MNESTLFFLLGCLAMAVVNWLLWEDFQFRWTLRHGLRSDLFVMSESAVRQEIVRAAASIGSKS